MVAGVALAALHPRIPSAAAAWAPGVEVEVREVGTAGDAELEEGCRKAGAMEGGVRGDWVIWWRAAGGPERCKPLKTPAEREKDGSVNTKIQD